MYIYTCVYIYKVCYAVIYVYLSVYIYIYAIYLYIYTHTYVGLVYLKICGCVKNKNLKKMIKIGLVYLKNNFYDDHVDV